MKNFLVILWVIACLLVAGCTTMKVPTTTTEIPISSVTTPVCLSDPVLIGNWRLTGMGLPDRLGTLTIFHRPITVNFSGQGTLEGNGGCNTYKGSYSLTGKGAFGYQIKIEKIISTQIYCEDASPIETTYFQVLDNVSAYWIDNATTLHMLDDFDGGTLEYRRT